MARTSLVARTLTDDTVADETLTDGARPARRIGPGNSIGLAPTPVKVAAAQRARTPLCSRATRREGARCWRFRMRQRPVRSRRPGRRGCDDGHEALAKRRGKRSAGGLPHDSLPPPGAPHPSRKLKRTKSDSRCGGSSSALPWIRRRARQDTWPKVQATSARRVFHGPWFFMK